MRENGGSASTLCRANTHMSRIGLRDAVAAVDLDEEAPQPLGRDVLGDAPRVDARARLLDAGAVQVGGEDLQRHACAPVASANSVNAIASE